MGFDSGNVCWFNGNHFSFLKSSLVNLKAWIGKILSYNLNYFYAYCCSFYNLNPAALIKYIFIFRDLKICLCNFIFFFKDRKYYFYAYRIFSCLLQWLLAGFIEENFRL